MSIRWPALWRTGFALVLALGFSPAGAQDAKPAADDPPIGTGKFLLYEDFEATPVGHIPRGYTKTGSVSVVADVSHSGHHSLRIDAAPTGARRITVSAKSIPGLGGQHWGRLYFKVQMPSPEPAGGVIHSTLVAGSAKSPLSKDGIEVRVLDTVLGGKGMYQWIYNVQPEKRAEFGKGSSYGYKFTDEWTLAEWSVDSATQSYRLFINGMEVKDVAFSKGAGNFAEAEIPEVFESLSFGWNNYQNAGKGFVAWIDDIALAKDRIGNRGIPPAKGATKKP
ncbi:MAG TPA: hypothetical protein VEN81_03595 [Planctomycetota bacterium]|nr:hypothetical protein [Planctomycetota bacterium]